jgi:hypothetical protein
LCWLIQRATSSAYSAPAVGADSAEGSIWNSGGVARYQEARADSRGNDSPRRRLSRRPAAASRAQRQRQVEDMGDLCIDRHPTDGNTDLHDSGGRRDRQEWVRVNFTQIFGISAADLQAQGVDPRRYAREHRDQIRQFARMQRSRGIAVPDGRPSGGRGPVGGAPVGGDPAGDGSGVGAGNRGHGYRGAGRFGTGMRGGTAWIGILLVLLALRFLLVDSFVGSHAAVFWVLGIGGIMLVARVLLFSWLRKRRFNSRQSRR